MGMAAVPVGDHGAHRSASFVCREPRQRLDFDWGSAAELRRKFIPPRQQQVLGLIEVNGFDGGIGKAAPHLDDVGMDEAIAEVGQLTTTTMAQFHRSDDDVPSGLEIPRSSWESLQT